MPGLTRGSFAAGGGMWQNRPRACGHVRAVVGLLLTLFALACGDERAPWGGFALFPPDASAPSLSPDLEARLEAATNAFLAQPDAGHAAGPAQAVSSSSASLADAGAGSSPRMAAQRELPPDNGAKASGSLPPSMSDAGVGMEMAPPPARRAAAGARAFPPRWPFELDAAVNPWPASAGRAGGSGVSGASGSSGSSEPSGPSDHADVDAGASQPAADGGKP